jgi:hypothetical protein
MATSPNFGWLEPDNTDLVKNGALAIRTAVNAIDASMAELKGGTTGQVLSKTSNTDMDFTWVAQDDSNAIQNAIVDAKGDLIAASAADTPARLAVGANNLILQAASSEGIGLKWGGGWTSYTPLWTASTTNPVIGNGVLTGVYRQIGNQIDFSVSLTAGTTTTYGSGDYRISLPVAAISPNYNGKFSAAILNDSVQWYLNYNAQGIDQGFADKVVLTAFAGGVWTNTSPFTFGTSDQIMIQGSYRVA